MSFILASYIVLLFSYGVLFGDRAGDCVAFSRAYISESPFCILELKKAANTDDLLSSAFTKLGNPLKTGKLTLPVPGVSLQVDLVSNAIYCYQKLARFRAQCKEHKKFVATYASWTPEQFQHAIVQTEQEYRTLHAQTYGYDQAVYGATRYHNDMFENVVLSERCQGAVLSQYSFYQYDAFITCIKKFDRYDSHIQELYQRVCSDNRTGNKWWKELPGFTHKSFSEIVTTLHTQVQQLQQEREQERERQESIIRAERRRAELQALARQCACFYCDTIDTIVEGYIDAIDTNACTDQESARWHYRIQVIDQSQKNTHKFERVHYSLSPRAQQLLKSADKKNAYKECNGLAIQQCIHQEMVDVVERATVLKASHKSDLSVGLFIDAISDVAYITVEYNKAGYIEKALTLADCCWGLLDCAIGIGEGLVDGAGATVSAFVHPIDTMADIVQGLGTAAWYTARVLYEVCDISCNCIVDKKSGIQRVDQTFMYMDTLVSDLEHKIKALTPRQMARAATGAAVEMALTKKCLSSMHALCKNTHNKIKQAARAFNHKTPSLFSFTGYPEAAFATAVTDSLITFQKEKQHVHSAATVAASVGGQVEAGLPTVRVPVGYRFFEEEVAFLKEKFNGAREFDGQRLQFSFAHIFEGEIYKNGGLGGFHHDYLGYAKKNGIRQVKVVKEYEQGFHKAHVLDSKGKWVDKTFFPDSWTRERVMNSIFEAFDNFDSCVREGSRSILEGNISGNVRLKLVIDTNTGRVIFVYSLH